MEFFKYKLNPIVKLNSLTTGQEVREGVLLKLDGAIFDYHPWLEFGDVDVNSFLLDLRRKGPGELLRRKLDLWSRRQKIADKKFYNHSLNKKGSVSKIKFQDVTLLKSLIDTSSSSARFRIDFNNLSSLEEIESLWTELSFSEKEAIEYFEDPCPKTQGWIKLQQLGIKIACDRNPKDEMFYDYNIYKPNVDLHPSNKKINIYSSYMGHDVGRYLCYLDLMERGDLSLYHGIDTPGIYSDQLPIFKQHNGSHKIDKDVLNTMLDQVYSLDWMKL